jgi:hypothetical protein
MLYREQFSKLLAEENIRVVQKSSAKSAAFDTLNRVLYLPVWDVSESVYDMLVAHEVSHALHTPCDRRVSIARYNITEDARIERLIIARYPGYQRVFNAAYVEVRETLFAEMLKKIDKLQAIDRLNVAWKLRDTSFLTAQELVFFKEGLLTQNFNEAVELADRIVKETKVEEPAPEKPDAPQDEGNDAEDGGDAPSEEVNEDADAKSDSKESSDDESDAEDDDESDAKDDESDAEDDDESDAKDDESDAKDDESEVNDNGDESEAGNSGDDVTDTDGESSSDEISSDADAEESDADSEASKKGDSGAADDSAADDGAPDESEAEVLEDEGVSQDTFNEFTEDAAFDDGQTRLTLEENAIRRMVQKTSEFENSLDDLLRINSWNKKKVKQIKSLDAQFTQTKPVTRQLVKEFKRRRNAHDMQKARQHRTGKINAKKLYRYKFDDNVFLSKTVVAGATNHGISFFIDFSGSMDGRLDGALTMAWSLAEFAKQCNVKFQIFGFLSAWVGFQAQEGDLEGADICNVDREGVSIFRIADDKMRLNKVRLSLLSARAIQTGGTPLDHTIIASRILHTDFVKLHNLEKSLVIFLTDGGNGEAINGSSVIYKDGAEIEMVGRRPLHPDRTRGIADAVEKLLPGEAKIINIYLSKFGVTNNSFARTYNLKDTTFKNRGLNMKDCVSIDSLKTSIDNHAEDGQALNRAITEIIKEFA